ncbi:MAG: hypothetical protein CMD92_06425 [Gammaproteobacteria bacterium]|nr:hypothetical protein [Gammaproteobacteria bacterium]|tara:strand:- start:956 stop:1348 length:393 start_codon:yes stop_codon:yes gene_type:complete
MAKIHGAASAGETLGGNINFYTLYVSGLDITATGSVADQTQQNLDDVVNLISLVAQPIIMNNPIAVTLNGLAPSLTGAGFLFKFAVEHGRVFERNGDTTSVLKELFENVTIDGVTLVEGSNIEYVMSDIL